MSICEIYGANCLNIHSKKEKCDCYEKNTLFIPSSYFIKLIVMENNNMIIYH